MLKQILTNKNLLYYLIGGGISYLGDILSGLAFVFIAYDLSKSTILTTGVVLAETIPYLLFGLIGGVVADWVRKRNLLIIIDLIRIPLIFSIVILHLFGELSIYYLMVIGFVIQLLGCFFNPAHRALLTLLTKSEERSYLNSIYDSITRGITVLTPLLSIFLISTLDVVHFFTFDAITYLFSTIAIISIKFEEKIEFKGRRNIKDVFVSLKEFIIWTKNQKQVKSLYLISFIIVFFNTWVWQLGILLSIEDITRNAEKIYSYLQGFFGLIVIITNLLVPFLFKKLNIKTYIIGSLIWGIGILTIGLFQQYLYIYFIGVLIVGVGLPLSGLSRVFILQEQVPSESQGRGFSFNAVILYFGNTLSLAIYGFLSKFVTINSLFIFSGLLMVIFTLVILGFTCISISKKHRRNIVNFLK